MNNYETPFLSICIPAYNAKKTLEETVRSCQQSDIKEVEIVISDNHSSDGTDALIKKLIPESSCPIRSIIPEQHLTMAQNWNFVVSHARGKIILLLSADDQLTHGVINKAVNKFKNDSNLGIVSFNHSVFITNSKRVVNRKIDKYFKSKTSYNVSDILMFNPFSINFSFFNKEIITSNIGVNISSLFRLDLLTTDYDFWIRATLKNINICYLESPKCLYRLHIGNLSNNKIKMLKHTVIVLLRNKKILKDKAKLEYKLLFIRLTLRLLVLMISFSKKTIDLRLLKICLCNALR